jgi:hypothetical protein
MHNTGNLLPVIKTLTIDDFEFNEPKNLATKIAIELEKIINVYNRSQNTASQNTAPISHEQNMRNVSTVEQLIKDFKKGSASGGGRPVKKSTHRKPRRHTRNYQRRNKRKNHSMKKTTIKHRKSYRKHKHTVKRRKSRRHH